MGVAIARRQRHALCRRSCRCVRYLGMILRNGRLNQTGYSLFLFIRDVADGDLVGWIDQRLHQASEGSVRGRAVRLRNALVEPLGKIFGVGSKVGEHVAGLRADIGATQTRSSGWKPGRA